MKKIFLAILGLILLVNFSNAQPKGDFPPTFKEKGIEKLLKLNPDQEKKFDELTYQFRKSVIDIRAKIQKNRLELKKMIDDNLIDEKKILQLTEENSKLQGEIKSLGVKRWLEIYKMLDADQKELWTKHCGRMSNMIFFKERIKGGIKNFIMERRKMKMYRDEF